MAFCLHLNERMVVVSTKDIIYFLKALLNCEVIVLLISMSVINQTEKECISVFAYVIHFNSDFLFVMMLFDPYVFVKTILGFYNHEFIFVVMLNLVVNQIACLLIFEALHSCSDLSGT